LTVVACLLLEFRTKETSAILLRAFENHCYHKTSTSKDFISQLCMIYHTVLCVDWQRAIHKVAQVETILGSLVSSMFFLFHIHTGIVLEQSDSHPCSLSGIPIRYPRQIFRSYGDARAGKRSLSRYTCRERKRTSIPTDEHLSSKR
jgi:hypothetical protein